MADESVHFTTHFENTHGHGDIFESIPMILQRRMANAKERSRTTNVNIAFSALRTCIPTEPKDRKLSKVETLRLAISYIGHLNNLIRARARGDYGGEVCQRYGCAFTEKEAPPDLKHICTFCLTDSKRKLQLLYAKSNVKTIAAHQAKGNTSVSTQILDSSKNCTYDLYKQITAKEMEEKSHHYSQLKIKEETNT